MAYMYDGKNFRRRKVAGKKDVKTGIVRRTDSALLREKELPDMVELYIDKGRHPETFNSYAAVAREMNRRHREAGIDVEYSMPIVKREIDAALEYKRYKDKEAINAAWNQADAFFCHVIEDAVRDYEESKKASSRDRANLLKTMMRDGGMTYEEATAEVENMRFSGDPDHLRVAMEAYDRRLKMRGVDMSGKGEKDGGGGGGASQVAGQIVNYNIGSGDMEKLKEMAKGLQDAKYADLAKDAEVIGGNGEEAGDGA